MWGSNVGKQCVAFVPDGAQLGCRVVRAQLGCHLPTPSRLPIGVRRDGVMRDGVMRDGLMRDELRRDGVMRHELRWDGMRRDGMRRDALYHSSN